jgi:hypothetical protein
MIIAAPLTINDLITNAGWLGAIVVVLAALLYLSRKF